MRHETVLALDAVNRRFYRERAEEFSGTRERPWRGWVELLDRITPRLPRHPRVLDVGCGNGRFARFLRGILDGPFRYVGLDASPLALDEARRRLDELRDVDVRLVEGDFLRPGLPTKEAFDLVTLFGVLHHVPGRANRERVLRELGGHLVAGGLFAFTVWRFDRHERFRKKLVAFEKAGLDVDLSDLEPGDFLMTWGTSPPALRYCHAMSDTELDGLLEGLDLPVVARFDASDEPNTYVVLGRGGI